MQDAEVAELLLELEAVFDSSGGRVEEGPRKRAQQNERATQHLGWRGEGEVSPKDREAEAKAQDRPRDGGARSQALPTKTKSKSWWAFPRTQFASVVPSPVD